MADTVGKLLEDIECEGFDYALVGYDDYSEIPDPHFQKLYRAYLTSRNELVKYLGVEDEAGLSHL